MIETLVVIAILKGVIYMMAGALAVFFTIVGVCAIANYRHSKSDEKYKEYLTELEAIKERKRKRLST